MAALAPVSVTGVAPGECVPGILTRRQRADQGDGPKKIPQKAGFTSNVSGFPDALVSRRGDVGRNGHVVNPEQIES